MPIQVFYTNIIKKRPLFISEKMFKMSWHCRTLFSLLSFEDIYITGTVFYHAGRVPLLLYAPHTSELSIFVHCRRAVAFLFGVLYVVAAQAYKFSISFLYLVLHLGSGCRRDRVLHFCDWNNKFVLLFLFLHELQHICYNLPCVAFQGFPGNLEVTWLHPACILATDVSFWHGRVCKNNGTSTTPIAETH